MPIEDDRITLSLQKVCDIRNFFDPEVDHIIRRELCSVPFGSRRAWEYLETKKTGRELSIQPQVFVDVQAEFDVIVPAGAPVKYRWVVKQRLVTSVYTWAPHVRGTVSAQDGLFRFPTRRDCLYSVKLEAIGNGNLDRVIIRAKAV